MILLLGTSWAATLNVGPADPYPTIGAALGDAVDGDVIRVAPGSYVETIDPGGRSVTIEGADGSATTLLTPPAGADAVTVSGGETLVLTGFTLVPVGGRGLVVSGSGLVATDVSVEGAGGSGLRGGSLFADGATVDLVDVSFSGGTATYGGQIYASGGAAVTATSLYLEGGTATAGGAIWADGASELDLVSVVASGSTAVGEGGFAWIDGASLTLQGFDLDDPSAAEGGGFYVVGYGALDLASGTIAGAVSTGDGGAGLLAEGATFTAWDLRVEDGSAGSGAGFDLGDGVQATFDAVTFQHNEASADGGALYAHDGSSLSLDTCSFDGNTARDGGGTSVGTGARVTDHASGWQDNRASGDGGAVYLGGSATGDFDGATFDTNVAAGSGGGVSHSGTGTVVLTDCQFVYNQTTTGSGGAVATDADLVVTGGRFQYNESSRGSGGAVSATGGLDVSGTRFDGNVADDDGGALHADGAGSVSLRELTAFLNVAGLSGGAIALDGVDTVVAGRIYLHGNAANDGGGVWVDGTGTEATFTNIRLTDNAATDDGGGAWVGSGAVASWTNNTFAGNDASSAGGQLYATDEVDLVNNIFLDGVDGGGAWGVTGDRYYNLVSANAGGDWVGWSDVTGTSGNVDVDPRVTRYTADGDETDDDLSLQASSPAIDAGSPAVADVDGSRADIGAFGGPDADVQDGDADGYYDNVDCDDDDARVHPGAVETPYDGIDQDCDGADLDDLDDDGYGAAALGGYDCDDDDAAVNPGAAEVWYDGVDQDCAGDDDYDRDGDHHGWEVYGGDDCDETDPGVHGGAVEVWYDGVDQNCDDRSDYDRDLDLHDSDRWGGDDCNDFDAASFPGNTELPYDGVDQDCSGDDLVDVDGDGWVAVEAGGTDCDDAFATVYPGAVEDPKDGLDTDCDGYWEWDLDGDGSINEVNGGDDCDDSNAEIHPGVVEVWYDGVDQDCDGRDDDQDGDGYLLAADCDDEDPGIHPDAVEKMNGVDDDCDGWLETDDRDRDGLMDITEWLILTDPENPDTDDDSLEDGVEWGDDNDLDYDLSINPLDADDDGDGIPTRDEQGFDFDDDGVFEVDVDDDGVINAHDDDSDGDGYLDLVEGLSDVDRDGRPDFLDYQGDLVGGGCAGGRWAGLLLGVGAFGALTRRRPRPSGAAVVGALAVLIAAPPAHAIDAHGFQLYGTTGDPGEFTRLGYPDAGKRGEWDAGIVFDYAAVPLAEAMPWGREPILAALATANIAGNYSFGGVRFEGVIPYHAIGVDGGGTFTALGDARLGALVPLVHGHTWIPDVALHTSILFPTGSEVHYLSAGGFRVALAAQAAKEFGPVGVLAMAGAVVSPREEYLNLQGGGGPLGGLGVAYRVSDALSATFELTAESDLGFSSIPVEASFSGRGRLPLGGWAVVGGGAGISQGVGASQWRAFAGVGWSFRKPEVSVSLHFDVDPHADRDEDGFPDVDDACPDQAETVDTYEDDDGCPELDGDGDGVAWGRDQCPEEAIHPEQDPRYSDGCPKVAEMAGDHIVITEAIFFREGKTELVSDSDAVLSAVAEVMNNHPDIGYFLIEGHTNANGSEEYNRRLSDARAYVVIQWLSRHGVEADRLLSKGFGESRPLVDAADPDALAINRRVEFRVIRVEDLPADARRVQVPTDTADTHH